MRRRRWRTDFVFDAINRKDCNCQLTVALLHILVVLLCFYSNSLERFFLPKGYLRQACEIAGQLFSCFPMLATKSSLIGKDRA